MNPSLESLASCWQGLIPATFYTCSRDGVPNAAYLSHVEYVDSTHVALSFQFFNKSRRNVAENPHALVRVIDPDTCQSWALRLRLVRSETSGPVFERMDLRLEAIASYTGLKGIFKLLAADIYEVQAIEPAVDDVAGTPGRHVSQRDVGADDPRFTMRALQDLSVRIHQAGSLDDLLDSILAGLDDEAVSLPKAGTRRVTGEDASGHRDPVGQPVSVSHDAASPADAFRSGPTRVPGSRRYGWPIAG